MSDTPVADTLSGLRGVTSNHENDARYAKAVIDVARMERDLSRKTDALRRAQEVTEEGSAADEIITEALSAVPSERSAPNE